MRGKVFGLRDTLLDMRITPAYAGKRYSDGFRSSMLQDHPRLCGEKMNLQTAVGQSLGSPPPMRGKAGQCSVDFPCSRITPAYAGKSD